MATGKKYEWDKQKLIRKGLDAEAQISTGPPLEDAAAVGNAAVEIFVAQVRADRFREHFRMQGMKRAGQIFMGNHDQAEVMEKFANFSKTASEGMEAEYTRLKGKY